MNPTSRPTQRPPLASFVVGITGGSGSGKTHLSELLVDGLGSLQCLVIPHDRYYHDHPELAPLARCQLDYDHPDAIETPLLLRHLVELNRGYPVDLPQYDYATHSRAPKTTRVQHAPIIVIEGLFVLADARLRCALDLSIFVHTPADLRLLRRIKRDTTERGQPLAEVLQRYETHARPGHERHVEPSRQHADLVWDQANDDTFPALLLGQLRARLPALS